MALSIYRPCIKLLVPELLFLLIEQDNFEFIKSRTGRALEMVCFVWKMMVDKRDKTKDGIVTLNGGNHKSAKAMLQNI